MRRNGVMSTDQRRCFTKKERLVALRPQPDRSILGAAGHIKLTPANQFMVMGHKVWSLSNPGFEPATFRSLAQRANQLR
jgi:hypothetical protein